ncbi:MAG: hypothetical protein ABEI27_13245 [Halobellus sp.]|uniref:DUF7266 family protein n=1 Tax=Halobellus sp. TaxID=1979212 RepID=UPI0035D47896
MRNRAVSITVNYVIALAITAVLISGLLIGAGGYVQDQREAVVREELRVVAEQLVAGIDDADRLARVGDAGTARVGVDLPERVAGETYLIEVTEVRAPGANPSRHDLRLRSSQTDVTVTLTTSTVVDLTETTATGGWTVVRLDTEGGSQALVLAEGNASSTLALTAPEANPGQGALV